jgi:hypothetical protein
VESCQVMLIAVRSDCLSGCRYAWKRPAGLCIS